MYKKIYNLLFITFIIFVIVGLFEKNNKLYSIYLIFILILLELSLSIDNAVINAKILEQMNNKWRNIFILLGAPISILFIRIIIPCLLVSTFSSTSIYNIINIILYHPIIYQQEINLILPKLCAFGAGFLIMIFLKFFVYDENKYKWIYYIEDNYIVNVFKNSFVGYILLGLIIGLCFIDYKNSSLIIAFISGIVIHEIFRILNIIFNNKKNIERKSNNFINFLYLEILDASFSFDIIIASFTISNNILLIIIGLSLGSIYVRTLTILLVEYKILLKLRYIEHGAHYAIGFLSVILFININNQNHIPEYLVSLISITFIITSYLHSKYFIKY